MQETLEFLIQGLSRHKTAFAIYTALNRLFIKNRGCIKAVNFLNLKNMNLENYKAVMIANITNVTNGNIAFSTSDIKEAHKVCAAYNDQCTIARSPSLYSVKLQTVWMKKKIIEIIE